MLGTDKSSLTEKEKLMNITLDATQQKELKKTLKCGSGKMMKTIGDIIDNISGMIG